MGSVVDRRIVSAEIRLKPPKTTDGEQPPVQDDLLGILSDCLPKTAEICQKPPKTTDGEQPPVQVLTALDTL